MRTSDPTQLRQLACNWFLPLVAAVNGRTGARLMLGEHNREAPGSQFSERFLQALWNEQRVIPPLSTGDGRRLEVLSPGTWNVSAGPDFRNAVVKIDGEIVNGDIEVHRTPGDWFAHGHEGDSEYSGVILHVVWSAANGGRDDRLPPLFELSRHSDAGLDSLLCDLSPDCYPYGRKVGPGRCSRALAQLGDEVLRRLFSAAGLARLAGKSESVLERVLAVGGDQAVYEGLMRALGYGGNKLAFRTLAETTPLSLLRRFPKGDEREACLWGAAGLLPDPTSRPVEHEMRAQALRMWRSWWKAGLPKADITWRRAGCRPLNSPERRLAAALAWLNKTDYQPQAHILEKADHCSDGSELLRSLEQDLAVESHWRGYVSFEHRLSKPARLLGRSRRLDIIVNIFLPFLHALGTQRRRPELAELAEAAWLLAPRLQSNRLMTEAVHRFIYPPSRGKRLLGKASEQQGLIEMYAALCLSSGGLCAGCPLTNILPAGKNPHAG